MNRQIEKRAYLVLLAIYLGCFAASEGHAVIAGALKELLSTSK